MGESLDMSEDGNHLIIGAHGGTNVNAFVYDYNSGTNAWDNIGGSTLVGTSASNFGVSSAISNDGNVIAVGANSDAADGTGWGRVYMYKRSGTTWVLVSTLRNPSGANAEYFGTSVSLSGDGTRLIAGAIYYDPPLGGTGDAGHAGRVYTFEYIETSWVLRGQHPVSSATNNFSATGLEAAAADTTGAHLGQSHSIAISRDGSTIIGGEYLADAATGNQGRVRVFSMPSNIKSIWGSNDDTNWTKITTGNKTFRFTDRLEFKNLDNPNYYKYHAIVADAFTRLKDVKLYGIRNQGSSTLNDGALTLTKNLDVPRIGPPLGADDTPRRDKLFVEYNTFTNPTEGDSVKDTSGRGFDSVFKGGASYDVTQKALKFDGSGDYTEVQLPAHYVKDAWIHSVSCWVKGDVINGEEAVWNIGDRTGLASGVIGSASTLSFNSLDPTLRWYFYNADAHNSNFTIQESQWYHIVCVYSGGVSSATSQTIYVNGVKYAFDTFHGTGGALNFDESRERVLMLGRLPWATSTDLNGAISQFKLYDCALTALEVNTLYQMGRMGNVITKPLHIKADMEVVGSLQIPTSYAPSGGTTGMLMFNKESNKLQVHNGVSWVTVGGIAATGGTITKVGAPIEYRLHTFLSSGTLTVTSGGYVDYLIIAGGGGGGSNHAAGGGGGGMITGTMHLTPDTYTITIGGGGAGGAYGASNQGVNGANSTALGYTSVGGGGGGKGYATSGGVAGANGNTGGSGGGGGPWQVGGAATSGQGNIGGNGIGAAGAGHGGGGGGAGGAGGDGRGTGLPHEGISGKGGDGLTSSITTVSTKYAGGGSGGRWGCISTTTGSAAIPIDVAGGVGSVTGGGGLGGATNSLQQYASAGTVYTGGGGGGGGDGTGPGGSGGSGMVIIRYLM
jgi:hypothetical protein